MAWLDLPPSGTYQIAFRFAGRKFKRSLDTTNPQLAEKARLRLVDNVRLVEQGRLDIPGHNTTFRAACKLRDAGLEYEDALALLIEWNETNAHTPWSAKELSHKIDSAYQSG
jgi:hypothetical protein